LYLFFYFMSVIQQILDTLKLIKDDGHVVDASKYFLSKRVLEIAYDKIHREGLDSRSITPYITAILDYRAGKCDIQIIKDKQTNEYEVYWQRVEKGTPDEPQTTNANTDGTKEEDHQQDEE